MNSTKINLKKIKIGDAVNNTDHNDYIHYLRKPPAFSLYLAPTNRIEIDQHTNARGRNSVKLLT
ncbi:hypothetical protein E2C01_057709 [Portunus trituberculatus]|uniref:Uncharacterized protein n=1 Tax=Portunus trituberculatus TaxID=210409 RepID=A0A5B7H136_PORTR|nr:hypothetical protein [Portunus trituberculatus]